MAHLEEVETDVRPVDIWADESGPSGLDEQTRICDAAQSTVFL